MRSYLFSALAALGASSVVSAAGNMCGGSTLGAGTAAAADPYWLVLHSSRRIDPYKLVHRYQTISHLGSSPYAAASDYKTFRNVMDYGAMGDGFTDDTSAIQAAIAGQYRQFPAYHV